MYSGIDFAIPSGTYTGRDWVCQCCAVDGKQAFVPVPRLYRSPAVHSSPSLLLLDHLQNYAVCSEKLTCEWINCCSLLQFDIYESRWHCASGTAIQCFSPRMIQRIGYGLGFQEIKPRQAHAVFLFSTTSREAMGSTQPSNDWVPGFIFTGKAAGAWC
jgi:hypothetical protein